MGGNLDVPMNWFMPWEWSYPENELLESILAAMDGPLDKRAWYSEQRREALRRTISVLGHDALQLRREELFRLRVL